MILQFLQFGKKERTRNISTIVRPRTAKCFQFTDKFYIRDGTVTRKAGISIEIASNLMFARDTSWIKMLSIPKITVSLKAQPLIHEKSAFLGQKVQGLMGILLRQVTHIFG